MPWVLDEEEAIKHIKYAYVSPISLTMLTSLLQFTASTESLRIILSYDAGIQTFDTANVRLFSCFYPSV